MESSLPLLEARVTCPSSRDAHRSSLNGAARSTTLGLSATLARIRSTVENALLAVADEVNRGAPINIDTARGMRLFAGLTAGVAGVDREADVQRLGFALAELFGLDHTDPQRVIVGNDAMLLSFPLLESDCDSAIAVIAGMPKSSLPDRSELTPRRRHWLDRFSLRQG